MINPQIQVHDPGGFGIWKPLLQLLSFKSSMGLEMMVFVPSNESRGPCATPGLRGWGLAERCGGTGDVAQLKGAVPALSRSGER